MEQRIFCRPVADSLRLPAGPGNLRTSVTRCKRPQTKRHLTPLLGKKTCHHNKKKKKVDYLLRTKCLGKVIPVASWNCDCCFFGGTDRQLVLLLQIWNPAAVQQNSVMPRSINSQESSHSHLLPKSGPQYHLAADGSTPERRLVCGPNKDCA